MKWSRWLNLKELKIPKTNIIWSKFIEVINNIIEINSETLQNDVDKKIGKYFAWHKVINSTELFAQKVLEYLWNDVFKYDRGLLFNSKVNSIDKLFELFASTQFQNIFNDNVLSELEK
ncbi:hypothetical protein EG856_00590 [Mycoplasmopsis phocirhinis]|uniref:Uncharacterized protein n=1 Tax=Mycoplasmopsis phocirhinis TaxID=142650 RepID=A0A4P6MNH3_9BACT|nr:hypothetical protein [Mycoplasmopsis phocirhinis]QBF34430.1 hypothetical protein EG856_00590 [Mycoplasmopsis phocirhinis]